MIELKINKRRELIPAANELTVNQYSRFMRLENQDIINYLSIALNVNYKTAFNLKVKNLDKLLARIGTIEDYSKISPKKYILDYDVKKISTVGQRFVIEESGKNYEDEELLCFVLAVALIGEPDINKIEDLKKKLMSMPYIEVLPTAFFLRKKLMIGGKYGKSLLRILSRWIKTRPLKNKQALIN